MMNYRNIHPWAIGLLSATIATAPAVDIVVTASPAGPVMVGDEVTISLSVSGWNAGDPEADAVAFNVDFDTTIFEFVTGSGTTLDDGTEYLALPSQGGSYSLDNDSSEALVSLGRYIFGATDVGDGTAGSLGPDGELGSFRLRAVGLGTSAVSASTNAPKQIFSDPDLFGIDPTGGVTLGSVSVDVVPPPGVTYASWAATVPFANQNDALPGSDPEKDGRVNLLEYFLDANPLASDGDRTPTPGFVEVQNRLYATLTYERPAGADTRTDTTSAGEISTDLVNWNATAVVHSISTADPVTGRETVVLRSTIAISDALREFLRLSVGLGP